MQRQLRRWVAILMMVTVPTAAMACYWDYDTVKQERLKFPLALELITGKFLRHSPDFYQWRIKDRLKKLETNPNDLFYLDDLGVAYQKTGQHEKAVETMLKKEAIQPGLYETYSNLGTFYIINGDFEAGLPYIDKALAINPDAHFGREKYQKWLVEYAILRRKGDELQFPLVNADTRLSHTEEHKLAFREYLAQRFLQNFNEAEALTGIQGMMRFANHTNPLLLEALGDLLVSSDRYADAKQLAAFSYLQASYSVDDPQAKKEYRELAQFALMGQVKRSFEDLEARFQVHLQDADNWFSEVRENELTWIREGKDADVEFYTLYAGDPLLDDPGIIDESILLLKSAYRGDPSARIGLVVGAVILSMISLIAYSIWRRVKARRVVAPSV